jgi:hypothetical protein
VRRGNDVGAALLESLLLGLLFLAPLTWALGVLSELHRGTLAATAAAREAGFDAARSTSLSDVATSVDEAVRRAFADHGLDTKRVDVRWATSRRLARGSAVEIEIGYSVPVFQAPFLGGLGQPSIEVRARHVARVDPYRSRAS